MGRALTLFLILTFGLSWGLAGVSFALFPEVLATPALRTPVFFLAVFSPSIAAFLTAWVMGRAAFSDFLSRICRVRLSALWYLGVPALFLGLHAVAAFFSPGEAHWPFASAAVFGGALALGLVSDPGPGEEFGWRGFLQPLLQTRFRPLAAALILGAIWGLWHLPVMILPAFPQHDPDLPLWFVIARFAVQTTALSVILAYILNHTRGAVLPAVIAHWAINLPWVIGVAEDTMGAWTVVVALAALGLVAGEALGLLPRPREIVRQRID